MTLEDEAMRWLYAVSQRSDVLVVDTALVALLAVFLVVAWRLTRTLLQKPRERGRVTPPRRAAHRPNETRPGGGTPLRPGPMPSARILGGEHRLVGRS